MSQEEPDPAEWLEDVYYVRRIGERKRQVFRPPAMVFGVAGAVGAPMVSHYRLCIAWWAVVLVAAPILLGARYTRLFELDQVTLYPRQVARLSMWWCALGALVIVTSGVVSPRLSTTLPWLVLAVTWLWLGRRFKSWPAALLGIGLAVVVVIASHTGSPGLVAHLGSAALLLLAAPLL